MNDNATYDIPPFNPHQNLSSFSKLTPFLSSQTHISPTENKSEATEVTITKVTGNSNAPAKKTRCLKLPPVEENHINSFLSDESINLVQQIPCKQFPDFV